MKAILISIKPKWVAKILNGEKTIEIRKTCPKQLRGDTPVQPEPIDVYIYCTKCKKGSFCKEIGCIGYRLDGYVVAKFTLNRVNEIRFDDEEVQRKACLTEDELFDYLFVNEPYQEDMKKGYAWNIDNLIIFDEPKELSEFHKIGYLGEVLSLESHLADIEGYNGGIDERYVKECYQCLDIDFKLTKAPESWCYVEANEDE